MVATTHHHENDDLWGLGVCFIGGAALLFGAVALVHMPAVQSFLDTTASQLWQALQGAFRVPRP